MGMKQTYRQKRLRNSALNKEHCCEDAFVDMFGPKTFRPKLFQPRPKPLRSRYSRFVLFFALFNDRNLFTFPDWSYNPTIVAVQTLYLTAHEIVTSRVRNTCIFPDLEARKSYLHPCSGKLSEYFETVRPKRLWLLGWNDFRAKQLGAEMTWAKTYWGRNPLQ